MKLAYRVIQGNEWQIEIVNMDDEGNSTLATEFAPKGDPVWSPDGNWLGYQADYQQNIELFAIRIDGSKETRLTTTPAFDGEPDWILD